MLYHRRLGLIVALGICMLGSVASAETILNFAPNPTSPGIPEFVWNGNTLQEGAGSLSNGDGLLLGGPGTTAPGLTISVPFQILGVPGSVNTIDGTTFHDSTLDITSGLSAPAGIAGNAVSFFGLFIQPLGGGSFEIRSSNVVLGNQLLLSGTIGDATITGINGAGGGSGSVLSATVTYTGGLVYNALLAGGYDIVGELSWSLLSFAPGLSINGGSQRLNPFTVDATGLFSANVIIPEPASLALLALGGLALRRRR